MASCAFGTPKRATWQRIPYSRSRPKSIPRASVQTAVGLRRQCKAESGFSRRATENQPAVFFQQAESSTGPNSARMGVGWPLLEARPVSGFGRLPLVDAHLNQLPLEMRLGFSGLAPTIIQWRLTTDHAYWTFVILRPGPQFGSRWNRAEICSTVDSALMAAVWPRLAGTGRCVFLKVKPVTRWDLPCNIRPECVRPFSVLMVV